MTREEAIENLKGCVCGYEVGKDGKPNGNVTADLTQETIDMAIKALEQEPCEDTISRQAAIEALYSVDEYNTRSVKAIKELPPVQPKKEIAKRVLWTGWKEGVMQIETINIDNDTTKIEKQMEGIKKELHTLNEILKHWSRR